MTRRLIAKKIPTRIRAPRPPTPTNTASPDQAQGPGLAPYGPNDKSCPFCRHRTADPHPGSPVWLAIAYNPPHARPRAPPGFPPLSRNCPLGIPIHLGMGRYPMIPPGSTVDEQNLHATWLDDEPLEVVGLSPSRAQPHFTRRYQFRSTPLLVADPPPGSRCHNWKPQL